MSQRLRAGERLPSRAGMQARPWKRPHVSQRLRAGERPPNGVGMQAGASASEE